MQADQPGQLSVAARQRFARLEGKPPLTSDWLHTVMIHYAVAPEVLRPIVPFDLDTRDDRAYVSLVAFDMKRLRPARFGSVGAALFSPIGNHPFLNLRTYVRDGNETGIYFLTEYLSNPISVPLGPPIFGLPYRWGRVDYQNEPTEGFRVQGRVRKAWNGPAIEYEGQLDGRAVMPAPAGSLTEFLMERYTAFTYWYGMRRRFRIWHEPWPQVPVSIDIRNDALLRSEMTWYDGAELCGANYSPGVTNVWMGRPRLMRRYRATNSATIGRAVLR